jgi:hypothetical protein
MLNHGLGKGKSIADHPAIITTQQHSRKEGHLCRNRGFKCCTWLATFGTYIVELDGGDPWMDGAVIIELLCTGGDRS